MTLNEWLREHYRHGDLPKFARLVGVCAQTLSSIRKGSLVPSLSLAFRISAATNGAVSVESLRCGPRSEWPMGARIFEGDPLPDAAAQDVRRRATERRLILEALEREFGFSAASAVQCLADAAAAGEDAFVWADRNEAQYRRTG